MTNQAEPFAPAPPKFYWTLHLESAAERARARNRGEERAVDEFIAKVNKAADLVARKNPDPKLRAEGYRNKPPELWAEQFLYFPEDCAEDWADWEKISPGDVNLREEMVMQIEAKLAEAGIDIRADDIHTASAKLDRFLSEAEDAKLAAGSPTATTPAAAPAALPPPKPSTYAPGAPLRP